MYKNNEGKIKFKLMHNFICNPPSRGGGGGYGQMIVWIMSRASIAPRSDIAKVAGLSRIQIFDCWRIKISRKRLRPRSGPVRQSSSCTLSGYGYIFNANTHIQGTYHCNFKEEAGVMTNFTCMVSVVQGCKL